MPRTKALRSSMPGSDQPMNGTFLLPVIGCAVHCGNRHAAALEDRKLLRGKRLKLMVLWVLGFVVFLPFAAVTVTRLLSDLKGMVMGLRHLRNTDALDYQFHVEFLLIQNVYRARNKISASGKYIHTQSR